MSTATREQIDELLDGLPEENLRALLSVLHRLKDPSRLRRWSNVVGTLSDEDAEEMRRVIEEGCEQVDSGGW